MPDDKEKEDLEEKDDHLDAVELEGFDDNLPPEKEEVLDEDLDDDKEDKDKKSKGEEKEEITLESLQDQLKDFEKQATKKDIQITNLNKAIHGLRQENKKLKTSPADTDESGEAPLTKAQLTGLIEEHKDDPNTMLNIIEYVSKQAASKTKKDAVNEIEISQTKRQADEFMTQNFPDVQKEGTELKGIVDETRSKLFLDDHPLSDQLTLGALIMYDLENIKKASFEQGKEESLKGKAEDKRKKDVNDKKLTPSGKKGGDKKGESSLTSDQEDVAKRLGLSKRGRAMYAKLKASKTLSAEV